ncbi:hypothetical protein VTK56DRAFT_8095 [Thermocarpiscus australiensis]
MSSDGYPAAGGSGRASGGGPGKHRGPRFTWNPQYEATFFQSLCESVNLGLRDGSTFKPEAWKRAMQALVEKHNVYANKGHLINKTDNARKKYRLWRGLREDPEFFYNAQTRTVTATDDAWARHLQKEPLARSLRARPFVHEEYYEILFPDVIGSGGTPKRLTKPQRKGQDTVNGTEEDQETSGTAILDLFPDPAYINPPQTHIPQQMPPTTILPSMPAPPPPTQQVTLPPPTSMGPPPPPRSSISSASVLTPPEETAMQTRKRLQAPESNAAPNATSQPPEKRRRTAPPGFLDLAQQQQPSHSNTAAASANAAILPTNHPPGPTTAAVSEAVHLLTEALRAAAAAAYAQSGSISSSSGGRPPPPPPGWQEQALDIFFRDFAGEEMDLQLKIAEKVLAADEGKAMVFCKMPDALRRHWVKRLREAAHGQAVLR